jgi:hypothetical protein
VLPCTHYIDFIVADRAYYVVIHYKPGIPRLNAICEAKISIIVTRHISSAVVYNDTDEVVNKVILK